MIDTCLQYLHNSEILVIIHKIFQFCACCNFKNINYQMKCFFFFVLTSLFILQTYATVDFIEVLITKKVTNNLLQEYMLSQKSALHQYFQFFNLSEKYFDHRWDKRYLEQHDRIQYIGGWPYYKPVKSQKFGLNVLDRYDNKDNSWITPRNSKEWPIAFHGIRYPNAKSRFNLNKTILQDILQGLEMGTMLKPGINNDYQNMQSVNTGQLIGKGVYCTPHFHIALKYAQPLYIQSANESFSLILQCRVNPLYIKVCQDQNQWVINNGQNIRPYAIILISEKERSVYKISIIQYGQEFKYQKYKEVIQRHLEYQLYAEQNITQLNLQQL